MASDDSLDTGALTPYRLLELAGPVSLHLGRIFRDMGADVIKIEPPGGDPSRDTPPFVGDQPGLNRSVHWIAGAAGKRSVVLDLQVAEARNAFLRLVEHSDLLVESFSPGYLESLGIGYGTLAAVNPRIVVLSITPFGQTGPHAGYQATDLTLWARGGFMHMTGDPDRPPVRISLSPQIYYHASTIGAGAALIALRQRRLTGQGQHIDLAMQALPVWMLANTAAFWDHDKVNLTREGSWRDVGGGMRVRVVYRCKDGYITWAAMSGIIGARAMERLVAWMDREGMAPDWLKRIDWMSVDLRAMPREEFQTYSMVIETFFLTKTKSELMDSAISDGHMIWAVNTVADVLESPQLASRGYWQAQTHPVIPGEFRLPGPPAKMSVTPWQIAGPAPDLGQHTDEVLGGLLGMSPDEILRLGVGHAV